MKKIFIIIGILFLYGCQPQEKSLTVEEVLERNIAKTSGNNGWQDLLSSSWDVAQKTSINKKVVGENNLIYFNTYPGYQRIDNYTNGTITNSRYYSPKKNVFISVENGKKGFTDIPKKTIYKSPVFELMDVIERLKLTDSISESATFYKVTDTVSDKVYVFDKETFMLRAVQAPSNYGKQTKTYQEYIAFDNYMIATRITTSIPASRYVQEELISNVKINPELDKDVFVIDESERKIIVGKQIPNFNFEDLDFEGTAITNQSLKGKIVLLDFWATWCGPCIKEIPNIERMYEKYNNKNFEVLSISLDSKKKTVDNFRKKKAPLKWKNTILPKGFKDEQAKNMEVSALPKVILINEEGIIIAVDEGAKGKALEKALQKATTD